MRNLPLHISMLLIEAADEYEETGHVFADTQARLDAEGYMLSALIGDVETILAGRF